MRSLSTLALWGVAIALAACGSAASTASLAVTATGDTGLLADSLASSDTTQASDISGSDAKGSDLATTDAVKSDAKADSNADTATDSGPEVTVPNTVCGDSFCGEGEDCLSCAYDCGECTAKCGDSQCGGGETCSTCPSDCGQCPNTCGNGTCEPSESCVSCVADCGQCPGNCGDGTCNPGEDCAACPSDCGKCSNTPCDPFGSKGCKANEQCYPYTGSGLVCLGTGSKGVGVACSYLIDCAKGLVCVNSACTQICDMTGKSGWGCPGGKQCVQLGQQGSDGAAVGSCL